MSSALASLIPKPTPTFHQKTYPRLSPTRTTFPAHGKTVLLTAGATGIGLETSRAFAQAGVKRLIILSRRPEPQAAAKAALEEEFEGLEVVCYAVTVTDYDAITKILREVDGGIDVLVLSHAIADPTHGAPAYKDVPLSALREVFETNTLATVHLVQTFLNLPQSGERGAGRTVIHVSSAAAHINLPGQMAYGPSKTAVTRMLGYLADGESTTAAGEGKGKGARIFSFHPGALYTEAAAKV